MSCVLVIASQPAISSSYPQGVASQSSITPNSTTLIAQGRQRYETGQFRDAIAVWQQAVQTYEKQGDRQNQALSLSYLSLAWQKLGDWQQAPQTITESLELLNQQPEKSAAILAHVLNTQGQLFLATGQADKAFSTWQTAEIAYRQAHDESGTIGTQINQAQALQAQGLLHRSQTILETATQPLKAQPASAIQAIGMRNLGIVWQVMGDLENSKLTLEASLAIATQLNLPKEIRTFPGKKVPTLTPPPTAPPLGKGRLGGVKILDWYIYFRKSPQCNAI